MTPERRREIASLAGKSVPAAKRSFSQNRELARAAGRKGGLTPRKLKPKLTSSEINSLADGMLAKVPREA
jgi:general stress protein YciG